MVKIAPILPLCGLQALKIWEPMLLKFYTLYLKCHSLIDVTCLQNVDFYGSGGIQKGKVPVAGDNRIYIHKWSKVARYMYIQTGLYLLTRG